VPLPKARPHKPSTTIGGGASLEESERSSGYGSNALIHPLPKLPINSALLKVQSSPEPAQFPKGNSMDLCHQALYERTVRPKHIT